MGECNTILSAHTQSIGTYDSVVLTHRYIKPYTKHSRLLTTQKKQRTFSLKASCKKDKVLCDQHFPAMFLPFPKTF